jgi:hypothetical protein
MHLQIGKNASCGSTSFGDFVFRMLLRTPARTVALYNDRVGLHLTVAPIG